MNCFNYYLIVCLVEHRDSRLIQNFCIPANFWYPIKKLKSKYWAEILSLIFDQLLKLREPFMVGALVEPLWSRFHRKWTGNETSFISTDSFGYSETFEHILYYFRSPASLLSGHGKKYQKKLGTNLSAAVKSRLSKLGCVFPMVIRPAFRMGQ